jgi:anti-anti-sigma factor
MLNITETVSGMDMTLFINGNFDDITSGDIEKKFEQAVSNDDIKNISIDLGNVRYLSSSGIRVLIIAHKKGIKSNKRVTLGQISPKAKEVLDTVGILPLFDASERV